MITIEKLRELKLSDRTSPEPDYLYSASGLVEFKNDFYIVADAELQLGVFSKDSKKAGRSLRLFPGELPSAAKQRKKEKPDLESITLLPSNKYCAATTLLAMPSLSRPNRIRGAILRLNDPDSKEAIPLDFTALHKELSAKIDELNIEGIAFSDHTVQLFHRGSKGNSKSSVVSIDRDSFLKSLFDTHQADAQHILKIRQYDLGNRDGVALAFTDASTLPDGKVVFLAAAEASKNAYDDGASAGSSIGLMNTSGEIEKMETFEGDTKLEGVSARVSQNELSLMLVSDSDDEKKPSVLYSAVWKISGSN